MLKLQLTGPMELGWNRKLQTSLSEYLIPFQIHGSPVAFYLGKLFKKHKTVCETGTILTRCQRVYKLVQPLETLLAVPTTGPTILS